MNDQQNRTRELTPKLRFPEFQDAGEWEEKPMGEVYSLKGNNSLSRDKLNYERGSTKNIHYGDIHTKFSTLFDITKEIVPYVNASEPQDSFKAENYCVEGDMIFADASEDLDDIGKSIEIVKLNGERVVSGLHTILARQSAACLVIGFGGYLFKSNSIRKQIQKESQGAKVLGISGGRLAKITIPFPSDKDEQQKIADCLSSLDELITLETQKLDTLKTHKKGLMQEIFPAEGETLPKLRFPEFREAGEWEERRLEDFAIIVRGGSPRPIDEYITNDADGINWLKIGDIDKESKFVTNTQEKVIPAALTKTRVVNPGDLILSNSMSFGRPYILEIKTCIHDGWIAVSKIDKSLDRDYLYYLMVTSASQIYFSNNAAGSGVQNLNADIIKLLPVAYPSKKEQKKIADCLSSLDELITAQTQKLDTLKTHKKGLMQQLFPALDEVPG